MISISRSSFCSEPKMHQDPTLNGTKPQKRDCCIDPVSKSLIKARVIDLSYCCVCFSGKEPHDRPQEPKHFWAFSLVSGIFEKRPTHPKKNENHPFCRCLEGNLSFCKGMMEDGGIETQHSVLCLAQILFLYISWHIFNYTYVNYAKVKTKCQPICSLLRRESPTL